ncbi:unnamed protein product [Vicia faba]|uniref:DM2 domain-containing protein n=1 Tax=Vicia faba TaxID=3906 RepID=A0AAV1B1Z6_VICFA|nr:unnamed protein product [Vicia faba]
MLPQRMKKVVTDNPKKLANLIDLVNLPPTLRDFVGQSQTSRLTCFMRVWSYVKTNNLQDPNNKNMVNCDEKLKGILLGKPRVELAELPALIKLHFLKEPKIWNFCSGCRTIASKASAVDTNELDNPHTLSHLRMHTVSSAWLLYKSSTAGNGFLSATLQGFSVFGDQEGVEQGFRLAIGKPESIGASPPSTLSYYENQESIDSSSSKGNNFEPVQTMLIVDMKFGPDSTFVSVCIQRPQLLVALDFLLVVVEFFVPTVSSMLSFEEHNSSMLNAIIIDQSIYKQPCVEFSLSPQKPLIVDDENFDHFIYDGDGGILYLKDGRGLNLTSASSEAIIYIGNGKKLKFRNVVIKGGQHLDSCVFLGENSSYSALNDDHVYLEQSVESPQAISPRGSVHEGPSQNNAANSSAEVIVELQAVGPELTFYNTSKDVGESSNLSNKLLLAQLDAFCR